MLALGHDTEVDLDAVPGGEAVAACGLRANTEAEPLIVRQSHLEITGGEDGRDTFHAASLPRQARRTAQAAVAMAVQRSRREVAESSVSGFARFVP